MKKIIIIILALAFAFPMWAQSKNGKTEVQKDVNEEAFAKVYDESADAMAQIDEAVEVARSSGRFVVCQVGGNWCPWCLRFAKFITEDPQISQVIKENFVYVHINTSKDNKNTEALIRLGNPGRFGYPALVILNEEGNVIHIQNSAYLEEGKGYNQKKVLEFFQNWTRKAIETIK